MSVYILGSVRRTRDEWYDLFTLFHENDTILLQIQQDSSLNNKYGGTVLGTMYTRDQFGSETWFVKCYVFDHLENRERNAYIKSYSYYEGLERKYTYIFYFEDHPHWYKEIEALVLQYRV